MRAVAAELDTKSWDEKCTPQAPVSEHLSPGGGGCRGLSDGAGGSGSLEGVGHWRE